MKKSILIACVFLGFYAQAQKKWTLIECLEYALENNISIKRSQLDLESIEADKLSALGNFLPSLSAGTNVSENTGLNFNPATNQPETVTFLSVTGNINMGYTLFDGLRNVRQAQRAKISELAAQYRLNQMKDDISLLVAQGYLQIILNKANLEALVSQNEVTKQQIIQTEQQVNAGVLPEGDLLDIKATDASEVQSIVVAENTVKISLINLAQLLLIKDYENFDIQDEGYNLVNEDLAGKGVDEIIASAKEVRNEVRIAEQTVELAKKDLQLAKAAYFPRLSAFFGYNTRFTNATSFEQTIDPDTPPSTRPIGFVEGTGETVVTEVPSLITREVAADPFIDQLWANDGIGYGLSLSIPILNGFNTRANVMRSKINLERAKFDLEQTELDLESTVYQAFVDAEGALKSYDAALTALRSQELAFEYAKERFEVGIINAIDFRQSKFAYDNAVINANRTKYEYIFRLKVLELYFGVPAIELKF